MATPLGVNTSRHSDPSSSAQPPREPTCRSADVAHHEHLACEANVDFALYVIPLWGGAEP
jgi:hypothetical protein